MDILFFLYWSPSQIQAHFVILKCTPPEFGTGTKLCNLKFQCDNFDGNTQLLTVNLLIVCLLCKFTVTFELPSMNSILIFYTHPRPKFRTIT